MLARVQIEHEVHQRSLEFRAQIPIDCEARAGQLYCPFQIEDAEFGAQVPVRFGSEVKLRRRAPATDFDILLGAVADRYARVRQIGYAREDIAQAGIKISCSFLQRLDLLSEVLRLGHRSAGVLTAFLQFSDFFRGLVALSLAGFSLGDGLPALRVDFPKVLEHGSRIHAALAQLFFHQGQIFANEIQIKHGELPNVSEKSRGMHAGRRRSCGDSRPRLSCRAKLDDFRRNRLAHQRDYAPIRLRVSQTAAKRFSSRLTNVR